MKDILSITKGNDFTLLLDLTRKLPAEDSVAEPVVDSTTDVYLLTSCGKRITVPRTAEAHVLGWKLVTVNDRQELAITIPSSVQHIDSYGLEVKGVANGDNWRYKGKPGEVFEIVDATSEQRIPDDQVRVFALNAFVGIGAGIGGSTEQVQSDWNEDDETSPAFIQHKPTIPSLTGYATTNYVNAYVNSSLTGYATTGYVNSYINNALVGYATQQWVNEQNFLKEHQSLAGYATQQWVNEQNFLKEHQSLAAYATQQWVNEQNFLKKHQSLDGYATQQWVNEQSFLKTHQDISGKENRMQIVTPNSLSFQADTGKYYRITQSGTISVTLPSVQSDYIEGFLLFFTAAADDCLNFVTQDTVNKSEGFEIKAGDICEVNAVYNGDGWQVTLVKFNS